MEPNAPAEDRQEPSRPTKSEQARSMARARAVARPAPSARPKAGKRNRPTRITDPAGQSAAERTVPQAMQALKAGMNYYYFVRLLAEIGLDQNEAFTFPEKLTGMTNDLGGA